MTWDYVIVGAGSAGCVLANRLTEDPTCRVLLLEAGGSANTRLVKLAFGFAFMLNNPRYDWQFEIGPENALGGKSMPYPRGRIVGGSSSINAMLYVRGLARDYDAWGKAGLAGWDWSSVEPYFRKLEDYPERSPFARGRGGPTKVSLSPNFHKLSARIVEAAGSSSVGRTADYNGSDVSGIGAAQIFYRDGRRCGSAAAYLTPASRRPNLEVKTDAAVQEIVFDGTRATGVCYRRGGTEHLASAARIIVSAGAIGSPQLLEVSGVGSAPRLQKLGIKPVHDLPSVGENLSDHYLAFVVQKLTGIRSLGGDLAGWRAVMNGAAYTLFRRGPMNGTPTQIAGHADVNVEGRPYGVQFMGMPMSFAYDAASKSVKRSAMPSMMLGATVCQPNSRGSVHAVSSDISDKPAIVGNFLSDPDDVKATIAGLRLCREVIAQPALASIRSEEIAPGAAAQDDDALEAYIRKAGASAYHPASTCRMATRPESGVVDARLKVHGLENLYVVDASVMPTLPSANTHAPTVMIAEKAADLLRER